MTNEQKAQALILRSSAQWYASDLTNEQREALAAGAYALSRIATLEAAVKLRDDELRRVYAERKRVIDMNSITDAGREKMWQQYKNNIPAELRGLAEEGR